MSQKFAIIIHSGPQDLARAVHGLLYAQELHEAGHLVQVMFDGSGTTWAKLFERPDHDFHPLYKGVKDAGLVAGYCEFCAGVFEVKDALEQAGLPVLNDNGGHPSLANLVKVGYVPLIM